VKLVTSLLLRRNVKTAASIINTADSKEISKYFDFYEFLYRHNPVTFSFAPNEMK